MDGKEVDLRAGLAAFRRHWPVVAVWAILAGVAAFVLSDQRSERYEASASLIFAEDDTSAPERSAATNLALASSDSVLLRVKQRLQSSLPLEDIEQWYAVEPEGQSDLVRVTASGGSAAEAVQRANVLTEEVVGLSVDRAKRGLESRVEDIDAALKRTSDPELRRALLERRQQLAVDQLVAGSDVAIADPAVAPSEPASPKPLRDAIVAAVLAALLSGAFLLARSSLRTGISEPRLQALFAAPVLAAVPVSGRRPWRRAMFAEAFRFLRVVVQRSLLAGPAVAATRPVIAVTSPEKGDGKTTVVTGLAEALADGGLRVLVVDWDLRDPSLTAGHGFDGKQDGLVDALIGEADVESAIKPTAVPSLSVLPAGTRAQGLVSHALAQATPDAIDAVLAEARGHADVTLIDTAPVQFAADAAAVAAAADWTLVVVDGRSATVEAAQATAAVLDRAGAQVAGVVINFADPARPRAAAEAYGAGFPPAEAPVRGRAASAATARS